MKKLKKTPLTLKKEFKKQLAAKLETVLSELKETLGEEEFHHRLKKASKVLAAGLFRKAILKDEKPDVKLANKKTPEIKTAPKKIKVLKKLKKGSVKKAVDKDTK